MELRRLSAGEWVAGFCSVLLVVSLFLPWYRAGDDVTGWQAFSAADIVIALVAAIAMFGVVATGSRRSFAVSVAARALGVEPALVAAVIVAWRVADPAVADAERAVGAWLGLVGGAGLFAGALAGMRDEGPERRSPAAERRAAESALRDAELLTLPKA